MRRTAYATDLTAAQWALIEPLIPPAQPGGRPRSVDVREIVNAIFYLLRSGCTWRLLPHDLPPWGTAHYYYRRWRRDGTWQKVHAALRTEVRAEAPLRGRHARAAAGGGGPRRQSPGSGRGQAGARQTGGPLPAPGADLGRRRLRRAPGGVGHEQPRLDPGDCQADRRPARLPGPAQALDRGADLRLARSLPAAQQGLRRTHGWP